jgi:hypothetical protein
MLLQKFQPLQHVTFRRARDARQLAVTRASAEQNDFGDGLKDRSINAPRRSASESLDALDLLLSGKYSACMLGFHLCWTRSSLSIACR